MIMNRNIEMSIPIVDKKSPIGLIADTAAIETLMPLNYSNIV